MPSCHFVHLILLSSGPKVPKSGPFKNEGIHEIEISPQDLHPKCREAFGLLARCLGQNYYRIEQLHSHGDVNISDIAVTLDEIISD